MTTFLTVLAVIGVSLVGLALLAWAMGVWFFALEWDWRIRTRLLHSVGAVLAFALLVTLVINSGFITSDNSEHCGPGTHYVSESHYSPATKTTITEWMCVA